MFSNSSTRLLKRYRRWCTGPNRLGGRCYSAFEMTQTQAAVLPRIEIAARATN